MKRIHRAHFECANYFNELIEYKTALLEKGNLGDARTMDIMGNFLRFKSLIYQLTLLGPMVKASQLSPENSKNLYLTKAEVVADSWLLLFAGHETTANTMHVSEKRFFWILARLNSSNKMGFSKTHFYFIPRRN